MHRCRRVSLVPHALTGLALASLVCSSPVTGTAAARPHVVFIVGDDVGYNDLGAFNGGKTRTPHLDELVSSGITLKSYYTFKICSPSRAAMLTGSTRGGPALRYEADTNHCTKQFTALPPSQVAGYRTHALGKWDVGFLHGECSPTGRGFDTFFGYYMACQADYQYHGASGGYPGQCNASTAVRLGPTGFSNSTRARIRPAATSRGTYNTRLGRRPCASSRITTRASRCTCISHSWRCTTRAST